MAAEPQLGVARVIAEMVKGKRELGPGVGAMVAGAIAKHFNVKKEDVAILRLVGGGKMLEFIVPEKLSKVGTIPMTSKKALVVRTVRNRRVAINNNFQASEHHTVFEAVKLTRERSAPIQKILSAPILVEGKAAAVIQVSRKGKTPETAGPDFIPEDTAEINQITAVLASCFPPR